MKKIGLFSSGAILIIIVAGGLILTIKPLIAPTTPANQSIQPPSSTANDLIKVNQPKPNATITSPCQIDGQARGYWFFEATFPIILTDDQGNILATNHATAQNDWMTTEFVPFSGEIIFTKPTSTNQGQLILKKDNPSGLSEYDDQIVIPVTFE